MVGPAPAPGIVLVNWLSLLFFVGSAVAVVDLVEFSGAPVVVVVVVVAVPDVWVSAVFVAVGVVWNADSFPPECVISSFCFCSCETASALTKAIPTCDTRCVEAEKNEGI